MKAAVKVIIVLALAVAAPAMAKTNNPSHDCQVTKAVREWDHSTKSPRIRYIKVCPLADKMRNGECATDSAGRMRCAS